MAVPPFAPGSQPVAFRTPNGDIVDGAIIGNILERNGQTIPKDLLFIVKEGYDTFPKEAYDILVEIYIDIFKLSNAKKQRG